MIKKFKYFCILYYNKDIIIGVGMSFQKFGKHSVDYVLSQWVIRYFPKDKEITELQLF